MSNKMYILLDNCCEGNKNKGAFVLLIGNCYYCIVYVCVKATMELVSGP